jgi:hypothetical protein
VVGGENEEREALSSGVDSSRELTLGSAKIAPPQASGGIGCQSSAADRVFRLLTCESGGRFLFWGAPREGERGSDAERRVQNRAGREDRLRHPTSTLLQAPESLIAGQILLARHRRHAKRHW